MFTVNTNLIGKRYLGAINSQVFENSSIITDVWLM